MKFSPFIFLSLAICILGSTSPVACYSEASLASPDNLSCNKQQDKASPIIGPDFIKWLSLIPKNIPAEDLCETVEITNTQHIENQTFSSFGQGSIFRSEEEPDKLFVLTAAHVVANSDDLDIHCGDKTIHAKIRGISQTKDLAVLELDEAPSSIKPLFIWNTKKLPVAEVRHNLPVNDEDYLPKGTHYIQTSANFVQPKNVHLVRLTEEGMKLIPNRYSTEVKLIADPSEHPLIGSKTAILLPNQGIKPGMSGSPIIYSVQIRNWDAKNSDQQYIEKHFLSGVLLKTYINETQSIAVPIETINDTLPSLLKGSDPTKLLSSPYFFEKKLVTTDSGTVEIPTVTFHTINGNEQLQSVCPSPFSNTSGKGGTGDSTGKGGTGDSTGKGGTDDSTGKGGTGDSTGKGGTGDSTGKGPGYYNSGSLSLYRDHYGCKETGIKDSKGNIYLAVTKEDGTISKAESIEDVSDLIQKYGDKFPDYLQKNGLKSSDVTEMYHHFCTNKEIFNKKGQPQKIKVERHDFDPKNLEIANYSSGGEVENGSNFFGMHMEVTCTPATKSIKLQASKDDFKVDLLIKPGLWKGKINFRGCQTTFQEIPNSPWLATHKDDKLDFQLSLSPDQNFLSFNIFAANSKCLSKTKSSSPINYSEKPSPSSEVWLSKINITLPKELDFFNILKDSDKTPEQKQKEQQVLKLDSDLYNDALNAISLNPKKSKEILKILHQNELSELEQERVGGTVSQERLGLLRGIITHLKFKLSE